MKLLYFKTTLTYLLLLDLIILEWVSFSLLLLLKILTNNPKPASACRKHRRWTYFVSYVNFLLKPAHFLFDSNKKDEVIMKTTARYAFVTIRKKKGTLHVLRCPDDSIVYCVALCCITLELYLLLYLDGIIISLAMILYGFRLSVIAPQRAAAHYQCRRCNPHSRQPLQLQQNHVSVNKQINYRCHFHTHDLF